jgi:hypothetical protein
MSQPPRHPRAKPAAQVEETQVLAALDRAVRHHERGAPAAPSWAILEHLGVPRRSGEARLVRAALRALDAAGQIEVSHPHGVEAWALTDKGRRRLRRVQRAGQLTPLPESPQHRRWRDAQTLAGQELERFARGLREQLERGLALLDAGEPAPSDTWFELADALRREARLVGSATHCLREWPEPDERTADIDSRLEPGEETLDLDARERRRALRMGRRNVALWRARN